MSLIFFKDPYQPNKIIAREKQIEEIKFVFNIFKTKKAAVNRVVQGYTGSGKTATINFITSQEKENIIYVSGIDYGSSHSILNFMNNSNYKNKYEIKNKLIEKLKKNPKVIIIDEIHKVRDYHSLLQDINSIYRSCYVPFILITNKINFIEEMEEDVRKTLFPEKIEFPSYNAVELREILQERIGLAEVRLSEEIQSYICARAAKYGGSARTVLDLAHLCVISGKQTREFIDEHLGKMEDNWTDILNKIPSSEKEVLKKIIEVCELKGKATIQDIWTPGNGISLSSLSQIITTFQNNYGIIKTKEVNKGRSGGRSRLIEIPKDIFEKMQMLKGYF